MSVLTLLEDAAAGSGDRRVTAHGGRSYTFTELLEAARCAAGGLIAAGMRPGDPVLILVADIADFLPLFWGTLYAGATPVPLAGPRDLSEEELARVGRVMRLLGGPVVVDRGIRFPGVELLDVGAILAGDVLDGPIQSDAPALIQFSSGSTRAPRGVVLSHDNLRANVDQLATALPVHADDTKLTWMPHFHDMGLIGCHLLPTRLGMAQVRMDPRDALGDPRNWLRAASATRATVLTTTNSALERLNRYLERGFPDGIDLSSVRCLFNGAEPISADVCSRFCELTGLPGSVHLPMYGLAEASVGVSSAVVGGIRTRAIGGHEVVEIGPLLPGIEVRTVGDEGDELPPDSVGHLQVRGPNVTAGYWRDPEATGVLFDGPWLRTGDLGCVRDGVLLITGRHKDVICVGGRNLHAHDVEAEAEAVDGVRPGGAVAVADARGHSEQLAVAVALEDGHVAAQVLWAVQRQVAGATGIEPREVIPIPRVPRTTSGKKRRAQVRGALQQGELDDVLGNTLQLVRETWQASLGRPLADDDLDRRFADLGGTSVMAQEILTRLERRLGIVGDHRILLRGETPRAMARTLERDGPFEGRVAGVATPPVHEPIAIVAAACRVPGARTAEEFWDVVRRGDVLLGPPPAGRFAPPHHRLAGGYLDDVATFDAARYGIDDAEAAVIDPQQRLLLTVADEALHRAGRPSTREVGVFVGAGHNAYLEQVLDHLDDEPHPGTMAGNLLNMIAARVAHALDLRGPALAVDTACSASLVALHLACQSLGAGECELALVGGVNLLLSPTAHQLFEAAGALSPSGRCRPFTDDADGMVPGEGVVVLALAPLSVARADGMPVLGVVRSVAINNDGASLGVMAPNPAGQEAVIRRALSLAGASADGVSFVEAHGTGTPIGDPVERAVLERVYSHGPRVGAVKGSIGHLLAAAGVAGLLRLLGELGPGELGAVSSFGFGGTNAHALIEAPPASTHVTMRPVEPATGRRYWIDDADVRGWVHRVDQDPAGGLIWRPCVRGEPVLRVGGRYLVTGGSGALGRVVARHLCQRYRARVLLTGRRPADDDIRALVDELAGLGGDVGYEAADLLREADVRRLRDRAAAWLGPVDGLFHLAGGLEGDALAAKESGMRQLSGFDAGFTALFSSISATLPGLDRGIEDYARANAALDRYARQARLQGRRVVSIAWPPWKGAGLAADGAEELARRGITPISPSRAMAAMEWALAADEPHVVVFRRDHAGGEVPPLPGDLRAQLRARVARAADLPLEQIDDHTRLAELGIDSLEAMDLVKALEELTGRALPTTLLYEFDTIDKVVDALQSGAVREDPGDRDDPEPHRGGTPLLPSQQTFVVQREFFPDIPGNVLLACSLTRPRGGPALQAEFLEPALDLLVERHSALRSVVTRHDGGWVFGEGGQIPTVRWLARVDDDAVLNEPFDLERGPLLRVITDGTRLALNAHHAAVDAWSLRNVLEELLRCHEALAAGVEPDLPDLGADWPAAAEALARTEGQSMEHWRQLFGDGVPPIQLPWDGPADAPAEGPCGAHNTEFDAATTRALEARAREIGVSLPALVLATYLKVLWRASGQHDLTVRVAHGRREIRVPDAPRLVGSFADSLPIRVQLAPNRPFDELADATYRALSDTMTHAAASSTALASLAERSAAGPVGLTPAGFSFPLLPGDARIGDLALDRVRGASASGFTRLGLIAWVFDDRLHCSWTHTHSHLRPRTVESLAEDHRRVVHQLLDPRHRAPDDQLHGRVLERCRRHPDRVAIQGLTYGALDRRSAAVAPRLRGRLVAVLAPPGADAVIGLLAVLRTGAAYVPLEPTWPDARLQQVLQRAHPGCLVTTRELARRAAGLRSGLPVIAIDDAEAEHGPEERGELAYVMFTSGSTGHPKGVMVSHRAVLTFHDWVRRVFAVTRHDRFVQTSSLAFGGSIRQIWSPLQAGATIHPVTQELTRDPDALLRFIRDERITIWNSVPSLWTHLLDAAERVEQPFATVRWMLLGGEAVPADHVRRWRRRFGDRPRLANLYGSTETVVNATWHEVTRTPGPDEILTPIGRVRAGQQVHLIDVVDGVGELAVGGEVADGYLGEPGLTAQAFVELPGAGRVYRTGDRVRREPDGSLVYLGRRDSQVQIYGNRVELGEVEATLCNHPGVLDAAVVERDGRLHATVQRADDALEPQDLRGWLGERLPSWMVPHRIVVAGELPRTPAGKADRLQLRRLASTEAPADMPPVAAAIAVIWQDVLQLDQLPGVEDDFFALGGDSLLALVVLEKLRARLISVPRPMVLYRHRRLGQLACAVEAAGGTPRAAAPAAASDAVAGSPPVPTGDVPLSGVQRGFWLAHQLRPHQPPSWCAAVPLHGPLDHDAFARALRWLVQRHPLLRMTCAESFAGPVQRIRPEVAVRLQYDALENLPREVGERALQARWDEESVARFDLVQGPLFRVRLCRLGPLEHRLMLTAHHIVADAWSAWLLAAEMIQAHDAFAAGETPQLPPPCASFLDEVSRTGKDDPWWSSYLRDLSQRPAAEQPRPVELELTIAPASWQRVLRRARSESVTPFLWVLDALFRALGEVLGVDDVVVATALSGRDGREEQLAGVVGPYATALPVRIRGESTPERVAASFGEACAHADASPSSVAAAGDVRALGRFFLSWLDPATGPHTPDGTLRVAWTSGRYRFATQATETEVMVGAMAGEGLHLNLHGGPLVAQVAPVLRRRIERTTHVGAALVVYAPDDVPLPVNRPLVVERVDAAIGSSELVALPLHANELASCADLDDRVREAIRCTRAPVVGLAGMLPAQTRLGTRTLAGQGQLLTTGHAATVVAMVRTLQLALERTATPWRELSVGVLGHGSIGRAVLALATHVLGPPREVIIRDPGVADSAPDLDRADWILGATSGGRALDVVQLAPGTVVIDDSFPRAFDDHAAIRRMASAMDVLLIGGGMLDGGSLHRSSPFPGADELRERFGALWLPGCHAEALVVASDPSIGPTVGPVDLPRALLMWEAISAAGLRTPPLHLGAWLVPDELLDRWAQL